MVPMAFRSVSCAPEALESFNFIVSLPSSCASSRTGTATVPVVSPAANVNVPLVAV